MKKSLFKGLSLLVAILLVLNLFVISPEPVLAAEGDPVTLVKWTAVNPLANGTEEAATDGVNKTGAILKTTFGASMVYSSNGYAAASNKWSNGDAATPPSGWVVSFSTLNYGSLNLSFRSRGSNTAPKNWKVQYSTDNVVWTDVPSSTYQSTNAGVNIGPFALPAAAENQAALYLRMVMADNIGINGSAVGTASSCTSNINNILVTGTLSGGEPTGVPTQVPTEVPTQVPTQVPTEVPTQVPTQVPTEVPTQVPTQVPTEVPTQVPTQVPTEVPTQVPTQVPTVVPTGTPTVTPVPIADYNIYFGQLHSHTTLSDGAGSVTDAFAHASAVPNLDFLAVTDHSNSFESGSYTASIDTSAMSNIDWSTGKTAAAAITASGIANSDNLTDPASTFLGIYGYEMTWSDGCGHMNTFNTPGFENRNNPIFCNKAQSIANPAGLQAYYNKLALVPGSISQMNHPGDTFGDFYDFALYNPAFDAVIDLIEVGNGEGQVHQAGYFPSYQYYTKALDKGWHLAPTNNQDNHLGNWGDSNTARTVILATELTETSLYDAMRNRRVYATEDNDLSIIYTLNDMIMGTISDTDAPTVNIKVQISDPTDPIGSTVEVIVNGGVVAASATTSAQNEVISFSIPNNYTYYYIRIVQPDTDTAVTAPVWTGDIEHAGISSVKTDTPIPVMGESMNITTTLYNNEASPMTVTSLVYSIAGQVIKTVSGNELAGGADVATSGTASHTFAYAPASLGNVDIDVTLHATINGVEKVYTSVLRVSVSDKSTITKVLIDGTHKNDYVNGYYSGNMKKLISMCTELGIQARIETTAITKEMLADTDLLIISAPLKYVSGQTPQQFEDSFVSMVADYVKNGGTAILCGIADYQDNNTGAPYKTCTQLNKLLSAMGAVTTVNDDEVVDPDNHVGSSSYRLTLTEGNMASPWLKDVKAGQSFSFYSGCSVNAASAADQLVNGHSTTKSINSKKTTGEVIAKDAEVMPAGSVCTLAMETVGSGRIFVAGTVFMSDFELPDNTASPTDPYMNYTIIKNILEGVETEIPVTNIADVRANGKPGQVFAIEGTVTAGSESPTAFFDAIYVQDATGGINIFPVANGSGILPGQKVRIVGHVDSYQGDFELKIGSGIEGLTVLDSTVSPVAPTVLTADAANDYAKNGGRLVKVTGRISGMVTGASVDGLSPAAAPAVSSFMIDDGSGRLIKVFMDGYITPGISLAAVLTDGGYVSAVGLVYTNPDGVCIRVRDRAEIQKAAAPTPTPTPTPTIAPTSTPTPVPTKSAVAGAVATGTPTPAAIAAKAAKTGESDSVYGSAAAVVLLAAAGGCLILLRRRKRI